jgi:molybdopterin-biosynthesis enzyme MoeA-like protein
MNVQNRISLIIIGDEILSSKRQDKHLQQANALLKPRGLAVSRVTMLGDEPELLTQTLRHSFSEGGITFCFGGIGATPDDRTRQCAAKALNLPLARHPEAVAEIEAQFGSDAYPQRIRMAEYPQGAAIIPNFYNRVPGFSIHRHHFMPGFPMMAKPMMEWVLNTCYADLRQPERVEKALRLMDGQESEWVVFMEEFEKRFPELRLFSLPSIGEDDRRTIDLGVEGLPDLAQQGYDALVAEAERRGAQWVAI